MQIGSIDSVSPIALKNSLNNSVEKTNDEGSFTNMLDKAIEDVNNEQREGYNAMQEIATGKVQNLQGAIQQIEEAELSLKLGLEVKNKALNAYKEVMRMQI